MSDWCSYLLMLTRTILIVMGIGSSQLEQEVPSLQLSKCDNHVVSPSKKGRISLTCSSGSFIDVPLPRNIKHLPETRLFDRWNFHMNHPTCL